MKYCVSTLLLVLCISCGQKKKEEVKVYYRKGGARYGKINDPWIQGISMPPPGAKTNV